MNQYILFSLGILLGIGIAIYFWADREEKIEKEIKSNQKIFSSKKLDKTMENVVEKITQKMKQLDRELTEEEKDEIIIETYKDKFLN